MVPKPKVADYHVHSTHSSDGRSSIIEMCRKAVELGIAEIGFAEHVDFDPADSGFGFFNCRRYSRDIERAREVFKNRVVIRKGVEIDYQRRFEDKIKEWLREKRFDFVIGSVHYLDHKLIDDDFVAGNNLSRTYPAYLAYLAEVVRSVKSGLFNVVGHLDNVRKYSGKGLDGPRRLAYEEDVKTVLAGIMEEKMYLEINSKLSSLGEPCADTRPSKAVVKEYIDNSGRLLSIGSDAHSTEELGHGIDEVLNFLSNYNENEVKMLFQ